MPCQEEHIKKTNSCAILHNSDPDFLQGVERLFRFRKNPVTTSCHHLQVFVPKDFATFYHKVHIDILTAYLVLLKTSSVTT